MPHKKKPLRKPPSVVLPLVFSLPIAATMFWFGLPGFVALWIAFLFNSIASAPPQLTGTRDKLTGRQEAGNDSEKKAHQAHKFWSAVRPALFPHSDWLPGWPIRGSWVAAIWAFAAAFVVPANSPFVSEWGPILNATAVFAIVAAATGARRRTMFSGLTYPGARIDALVDTAKQEPLPLFMKAAGGLALGSLVAMIATIYLLRLAGTPLAAIWFLGLTGGLLLTLLPTWSKSSLEPWRTRAEANGIWQQRWLDLKVDPAPTLSRVETLGDATVYSFEVPGSVGAARISGMAEQITPMVGGGIQLAVLDSPNTNSVGEPVEGTRHPTRCRIVVWSADSLPDIASSQTSKELVALTVESALRWVADSAKLGRPILKEFELVTGSADADETDTAAPPQEEDTQVWRCEWSAPDGPDPVTMRTEIMPAVAKFLNQSALVDHRKGLIFLGAIDDPDTGYSDSRLPALLKNLATEDQWLARWVGTDKFQKNPPTIQHPLRETAMIGGKDIHYEAFLCRLTQKPEDFFGQEKLLATVMSGPPFINITGFPMAGARLGERHPQGIAITWSMSQMPSEPGKLAPEPGKGPRFVLASMMNRAFEAARLARPEITHVRCLTTPKSSGHLWEIGLRLHGGVTLADVRGAAERIRQHLASPWARVVEAADGISLVIGSLPSSVTLDSAENQHLVTVLDWEQGMVAAGVTGTGGKAPKLVRSSRLEGNHRVAVLDFELPSGLDIATVRGARNKLSVATGNSFVDVRGVPEDARIVRILASESEPIPSRQSPDYDAMAAARGQLLFATGIEGTPVGFDLANDIHLSIVGGSGSGKSVFLQDLVAAALLSGMQVAIGDAIKGANDLRFATPYALAFATTLSDVAAMMRGIYEDIVAPRVALLSSHGVEKIENLPEDIRPPRMLVLLDEFTSLLTPDVVPPGSDDFEFNDEREVILSGNRLKAVIATFTAKITREARSAGVTFVLATQKLTADDLKKLPGGSTLKVNLSRIIAGKATWGELAAALKRPQVAPELGDEPPPGRAIFESAKGSPLLIQGWWAQGGQEELTGELNARIQPLDPSDKLDLERFQVVQESNANADPEHLPPSFGAEIDLGRFELDLTDTVDEAALEQASQIDWDSLTIADDGDQNQAKNPDDSSDELPWDLDQVPITEESALEDEGDWLTSLRSKIKTKISLTDLEFDE